GIGLRGYGQKDPLNEYKKEGFDLFSDMIFRLKSEVTERLFRVEVEGEQSVKELDERPRPRKVVLSRSELAPAAEETRQAPVTRGADKVGRNDPCPCGSGKKYKKCCGK
ncbi:MAG: SEC-C domain-containing protein, partial [Deltaproteobacteria bacterium]|nr:SEC-C domain-containing protein [Deltaproteobacteria bacterium]